MSIAVGFLAAAIVLVAGAFQRRRPLLYLSLVIMLAFAGAHAATSASTDAHTSATQLLILVSGVVLSWYALIAVDQRLRAGVL